MRASGDGFQAHEAATAARGQHLDARARLLRARTAGGHDEDDIARLVLPQPLLELERLARMFALDHGVVDLARGARAEGLGHARRALARAGVRHDAGHGPVEPMDDAEEHGAGLVVALGDPRLGALQEALVAAVVGHDGRAGGLVHGEHVVVLVQHLEDGARAGAHGSSPRRWRAQKPHGSRRPPPSSSRASSPASTRPGPSSASRFWKVSGEHPMA